MVESAHLGDYIKLPQAQDPLSRIRGCVYGTIPPSTTWLSTGRRFLYSYS